jgi:hypothetical protein
MRLQLASEKQGKRVVPGGRKLMEEVGGSRFLRSPSLPTALELTYPLGEPLRRLCWST